MIYEIICKCGEEFVRSTPWRVLYHESLTRDGTHPTRQHRCPKNLGIHLSGHITRLNKEVRS